MKGIDFCNLTVRPYRNGAIEGALPTVVDRVTPGSEKPWVVEEWMKTQALTKVTVKVTIPGPLTILDTVYSNLLFAIKPELY